MLNGEQHGARSEVVTRMCCASRHGCSEAIAHTKQRDRHLFTTEAMPIIQRARPKGLETVTIPQASGYIRGRRGACGYFYLLFRALSLGEPACSRTREEWMLCEALREISVTKQTRKQAMATPKKTCSSIPPAAGVKKITAPVPSDKRRNKATNRAISRHSCRNACESDCAANHCGIGHFRVEAVSAARSSRI